MNCILCEKPKRTVDSHIIPNFIRKRLTGLKQDGRVTFRFHWADESRPTQNLPTKNLLCRECDSELGAVVEGPAAKLMLPEDADSPESWEMLPWHFQKLTMVAEAPLWGAVYRYERQEDEETIARFALLTAWRALHAVAMDDETTASAFLRSPLGRRVDENARRLLRPDLSASAASGAMRPAEMYFLGFQSASLISGKDDELPFAWAFLEDEDQEPMGVGVIMGPWVVLWPFFDHVALHDEWMKLVDLCFVKWHGQVVNQLKRQSA